MVDRIQLQQRRAKLSDEQKRLLRERIRGAGKGGGIHPRDPASSQLMSFAQQRLWFMQKFDPDSYVYNECFAFQVDGVVDVAALESALQCVIQRHEILRTCFPVRDGRATPEVRNEQIRLVQEDFRDLAREQSNQRVLELFRSPFMLESQLPWRTVLLHIQKEQSVLVCVMHHIVCDGWSMAVLIQELMVAYERYTQKQIPSLPPLDVQYLDFAHWQHERMQGELRRRLLDFWKRQLADVVPLNLPLDKPRPEIQTFHGAEFKFEIPAAVCGAIKKYADSRGLTPYMLLLAAYQLLLYKLSGQEKFVIGTVVANRKQENEQLIGFFVNTLPVTADFSTRPTLAQLLEQIKTRMLAVYEHQELPFELMLNELNIPRHLNRQPIFQVLFLYQNMPMRKLQLAGLELQRLGLNSGTSKFDLTLELSEANGILDGRFEYNADIFTPTSIKRFTALFRHFLLRLGDLLQRPVDKITPSHHGGILPLELPQLDGSLPHEEDFVEAGTMLSQARAKALAALAEKQGAAFNDVLMAAFCKVLCYWNRKKPFTVTVIEKDSRWDMLYIDAGVKESVELWVEERLLAKGLGENSGGLTEVVFTNGVDDVQALLGPEGKFFWALEETADGIRIHWWWRRNLCSQAVADAIGEAYGKLLDALNDPVTWLQAALTLLPQQQVDRRRQVNATHADRGQQTLHGLFIQQAILQPDAIAVLDADRACSYRQLNSAALRIAKRLAAAGVEHGNLVAVYLRKGWRQFVAVLGTLMVGAAYMPVDPALPEKRRQQLLQHAQNGIVLTDDRLQKDIELPSHAVVITESVLEAFEGWREQDQLLLDRQQPRDLAYVIFTSGSTGVPKGVMIDHRGAVNTIVDMNRRFQVTPQDQIYALSALNFDLSVYDIFGTLAAGATAVLPHEDAVKDPQLWRRDIECHRVSIFNAVPALVQMLLEHHERSGNLLPKSLRCIWMSGDWIALNLPEKIHRLGNGAVQAMSLGGATEASIWSILYPIHAVKPQWKSIPYGKPMENQAFHILHKDLTPCPDGVQGDIFIAGGGLALGYWGDAEKTATSFIVHPRSGERLYRTGDTGRYWDDGNIEFLGREDQQVKINGFRIELGEIEAVLQNHRPVHQAVAIVRENKIFAYVVGDAQALNIRELQQELVRVLPEYMQPANITALNALPLTANGKVDRARLPALSADSGKPYFEPDNDLERQLAEIWKSLLRVQQVSVVDNFFEIGASSMLMVEAQWKLQQTIGREIAVVDLFRYPSIRELAKYLSDNRRGGDALANASVRAKKTKQAIRQKRKAVVRGGSEHDYQA